MFTLIMIILGVAIYRNRRKKPEKRGNLLVIWNWILLFYVQMIVQNCKYAFTINHSSILFQWWIRYLASRITLTAMRVKILTYQYLIYPPLLMQPITFPLITNWGKEDLDQFIRYNGAFFSFFFLTMPLTWVYISFPDDESLSDHLTDHLSWGLSSQPRVLPSSRLVLENLFNGPESSSTWTNLMLA